MSTPGGVNISDGYFSGQVTDLSIGTLKLDRFALAPSKLPVNDPYFGLGITNNFDIYVAPNFIKAIGPPAPRAAEYHPIVHLGQGASGVYLQSSPTSTTIGSFNREADSGILALVGGAYVYTDSSGTIYTFNPSVQAGGGSGVYSQRIDNILYPDGRRETFSYDTNKLLKMVSDTAGYAIVFDYNSDGDVAAACGFNLSQDYVTASSTCSGAALKTTYTYTSKLLTGVTDVMGQTTTYSHSTGIGYGNPITCVMPPGYTICKIANAEVPRIGTQTLADGSIWQLAYDITCVPDPDFPEASNDGSCSVDVTDPNNKVSHYGFTKSSPGVVVDANGKTTWYKWTGSNLNDVLNYDQTPNGPYLIEVDYPEGDKYFAEYNGPWNAISKATRRSKTGSTSTDLVEEWGYAGCYAPNTLQNCGKPIWKKDAKGNQADYAYYAWGGTQWEMPPAPSAGAARPLKLYTYVQKYAYVKDSGGSLIAAATQIWVPDTITECQTVSGSGNGTPVCDTSAPQRVTAYEYATSAVANNLLPRGMTVTAYVGSTLTTLRTCYGYDPRGRKISTTTPGAGLTGCPL
ncbi:MAG: hypothetical protein E7773_07805 [Sphingomonas sp.]|uniref:hypothetical protein n=1 Tax=Sphingomonas sp. TaxID=28214 RepID=UPI001217A7E1|nr:hypothetical protein [Sphingomonas sp.]THD36405.1 MAG: hypothetical protein E7773_07805 [Sphingomonas sp.]